MQKPEPVPGLVIRYDYLWRDEAAQGRQEGAKERPCAVVVAKRVEDGKPPLVLLAPITHSPPTNPKMAIEIPAKVKRHLGLDDERSWIITGELNSVAWDDAGIVPVSRDRWDYGLLPTKLATNVRDEVAERQRTRSLGITDRVLLEKQRDRDGGRGR